MTVQLFPGLFTPPSASLNKVYSDGVLLGDITGLDFLGANVSTTIDATGQANVAVGSVSSILGSYDSIVLAKSPIAYFPPLTSLKGIPVFKGFTSRGTLFPDFGGLPVTLPPPIVRGAVSSVNFSQQPYLSTQFSSIGIPQLNMFQNRSLEFWMRYLGGPAVAISVRYTPSFNNWIQFEFGATTGLTTADRLYLARWNGGWSVALSPTPLINNTIYHCVATWDTSRAYLYLNGVLTNPGGTAWTTFSTFNDNQRRIWLGRTHNDSVVSLSVSPMSHIAMYDKVLTSAEVLENYNAGV